MIDDRLTEPASRPEQKPSGSIAVAAAGLIVVAGLAAYANSFSGPFIYDDPASISNNPTIRQLWSIGRVLSPPRNGETVSGRPLLNLSFAIDYAIGGTNSRGYHVTNLAIHLLNGLLLLGILRRTFCQPLLRVRFEKASLELSLAIALLWVLHPLQTESVTYIVQRAESLAALFYLVVLYGVIRGMEARQAVGWYALAVVACFLGVATKEIVATAPLLVLLYDRTLVSGTFRESLRRRWGLYCGLTASWMLLAGLVWWTGFLGRRREMRTVDAWSYARSQPGVILHYLRLSLWPHPLCLSYEWPVAKTLGTILPAGLAVGTLVALTLWGLARRSAAAILGASMFLILAPTSSIVPLNQLAFEHRMYLPLAAVVTMLVAGGYLAGRDAIRRGWLPGRATSVAGVCLVTLAAVVLGLLTYHRNVAYQSPLSIWEDTVEKVPDNPSAHNNLGLTLANSGNLAEAVKHYEEAIRLKPDHALARNNLGNALVKLGRPAEAIEHYRETLRLRPDYANAHVNLGNVLANTGRLAEAIEHYQEGLRLQPDDPFAHSNLGLTLAQAGRVAEAIEHYQEALRLKPDYSPAQYNWANALFGLGQRAEALRHYEQALSIDPENAEACNNLGSLLADSGRLEEAIEQFQQALRLNPELVDTRCNLAKALVRTGRLREAVQQGREAIRLAPNQADVYRFLAWLIATHEVDKALDPAEAVKLAEQACTLAGRRDLVCLDTLAAAYASAGRFAEAESTAKDAWQMAQAAGQDSLAEELHMRLQLYRDRKPYREPTGSAASGRL